MGEYADDCIDAGIWGDEPWGFSARHCDDDGPRKACHRCGKDGLHWERDGLTRSGWSLYEDNERHMCRTSGGTS